MVLGMCVYKPDHMSLHKNHVTAFLSSCFGKYICMGMEDDDGSLESNALLAGEWFTLSFLFPSSYSTCSLCSLLKPWNKRGSWLAIKDLLYRDGWQLLAKHTYRARPDDSWRVVFFRDKTLVHKKKDTFLCLSRKGESENKYSFHFPFSHFLHPSVFSRKKERSTRTGGTVAPLFFLEICWPLGLLRY